MAAESKRRKVDDPAPFSRTASSSAGKQETFAPPPRRPMTNAVQNRGLDPKIQQARDYAVAQAQQDGCMANFKIIDSPFGNFLLPFDVTGVDCSQFFWCYLLLKLTSPWIPLLYSVGIFLGSSPFSP
ncbi:hypothetical protein DCAR_0830676 [Daucus carota subsp. sativus]|uniref:Uncharacterized protein n=1 Tax=Daucus carota subsp. sativus TaxID=79200 RepID=A0AAF1BCH0_DAUCS|nr:hypothetical protein DCAR_0830676 [Daucus carota subsp. sativus]